SGRSSGGISSSAFGGCLGTGFVACGSVVGVANASWTGPRASTSTPFGTGGRSAGASWARATAAAQSRAMRAGTGRANRAPASDRVKQKDKRARRGGGLVAPGRAGVEANRVSLRPRVGGGHAAPSPPAPRPRSGGEGGRNPRLDRGKAVA